MGKASNIERRQNLVDLASAFSDIPNVTQLDEMPESWRWSLAPGFDFCAALSRDGQHLFQAYALDSYDESLATGIMSFAREHDAELIAPPERPLVVVEGFDHPGYAFDILVAVGPTVHGYPDEAPDEIHELTRAIFPAYRCEFAGDENRDEAHFRYARAAGVPATRWDREPHPFVKMRHQTESGRVIRRRGFTSPNSVTHEISLLVGTDRFVEFENYRHQVWRVEWDGQWVVTDQSGHSQRFAIDDMLEFAQSALYGPNLAAGTSEFTKRL